MLAVATTSFLLLLLGGDTADAEAPRRDANGASSERSSESIAREATEEATATFEALWEGGAALVPKLLVVTVILLLAWGVAYVFRRWLRRALGRWERGHAAAALAGAFVWLLALGAAVSVLVGDIRALIGSLGLVGLALSWALQNPIESTTGWLLNSFKGYYRIGDRIAVGDVFGDVVDIDFLTTTVWEIGGLDHPSSGIRAEQPTGRVITFPNNEVLTGSIVNYTADFEWVWDELAISIATESDIRYAAELAETIAHDLLGKRMQAPIERYRQLLKAAKLPAEIPDHPTTYFALTESGVDLTVRYLVGARERRQWKSDLTAALIIAFNDPQHAMRVLPVYPRRQVQVIGPDGRTGVRP